MPLVSCFIIDYNNYIQLEMKIDDEIGNRIYINNVESGIYEITDIDHKTHPNNPIYILRQIFPKVEYYFIFIGQYGDIDFTELKTLKRRIKTGDLIDDIDKGKVFRVIHISGRKVFVTRYNVE